MNESGEIILLFFIRYSSALFVQIIFALVAVPLFDLVVQPEILFPNVYFAVVECFPMYFPFRYLYFTSMIGR